MSVYIDTKVDELQNVLSMWEFMNENDGLSVEECKELYGEWTDDDGKTYVVQTTAMKSVIEFIEAVQKWVGDVEKREERDRWDLKVARQDAEYWKERACLSDSAVSDLVFEYIEWAKKNDNEENLQWTDVKLLEMVRGRLK